MKRLNKLVAILLAVALLFTVAGCGENTKWAYELDGEQMPAGVYIAYLLDAFYQASNIVYTEGVAADALFAYTDHPFKEIITKPVEGQDFKVWVKNKAQESARKYFAVEREFSKAGLAFDDEYLKAIDASAGNAYNSYKTMYESNGISESSLRLQTENSAQKQLLFESIYAKGGTAAVSEAELKAAFKEKYVKANYMQIPKPTDFEIPEGKTREEMAAETKKVAEEYAERLRNGETVEDLAYEYELSKAEEDEKDTVTKPEEGSRTLIVNENSRATYGDFVVDSLFATAEGKTVVYENDTVFFVVNRIDILADAEDFEDYQTAVLYLLKSEEFENNITAKAAELDVKANQKAISRYKVEKLVVE